MSEKERKREREE